MLSIETLEIRMSVKMIKFYNYNLKYDIPSAMSSFQTIHQILKIPLDIPKLATLRLELEELFKIKIRKIYQPIAGILKNRQPSNPTNFQI